MRPALLWLAVTLCSGGCNHIAQRTGVAGWFTVDDKSVLAYPARFTKLPMDDLEDCPSLLQKLGPTSLVVVLVHGVKGDGTEMLAPMESFPKLPPHTLLMYRWAPWLTRDTITEELALGINRLSRCLAGRAPRLLVIGHSAGGVVCSYAAHQLRPSPEVPVTIVTVASPLSGSNWRRRNEGDREEATFMLDLGSDIRGYPAPGAGVTVLHLRTNAKSDQVMEPGPNGHLANDPAVGVPGAEQIDLPDTLTHDGSLAWVVERLVEAGGDPTRAAW